MKRRDFVKTVAMSGMAIAASDLVGDLIAQTPQGKRARVEVQGPVGHRARSKRRRSGCTYADIRFTRNTNSGVNASGGNRDFEGSAASAAVAAADAAAVADAAVVAAAGLAVRVARPAPSGAAGFGVRVIHSGVWGFASSPIVTEDEIRRITRMATEVAKASAIAKQRTSSSRRSPAYTEYWATPIEKDPRTMSRRRQAGAGPEGRRHRGQEQGSRRASTRRSQLEHEWKYFATSEGSYIEQEIWSRRRRRSRSRRARTARRGRAPSPASPMTGGWEVAERGEDARERRAHRRRGGRVLHRQAGRDGRQGSGPDAVARDADDPRDRRARHRARSHPRLRGQLRRHQLREDLGPRQAEVRLEAVQRHRRQDDARRHRHRRLRRRRREDAGVADRARRHPRRPADQPRDGALHRREGEPRLHARRTRGATIRSCACRTCTSSRVRRDRRRRRRSSPTRRTAC